MRCHWYALSIALVLALVACGKVQEKATEKMAEKAIESSLAKDGTQAKVNLSDGGVKVTTTDATGKSTQMEMGNAKISEAELGVPFYPGAKPTEGAAVRVVDGSSKMLQMGLHSDDAHDKVAAFYRDKLKAMSDGRQFVDASDNDHSSLTLVDEKAKTTLHVEVSKADKGSEVMIHASREGSK